MKKIKLLIVDDSALIRQLLVKIVEEVEDIQVVGTAGDPYEAREKIKALNPDVLTLDIEMPRMDGLTFLGNLMRLRPMPVLMVSTLTARGAEATMAALALGAVDFVTKPQLNSAENLRQYADEIVNKIRTAAKANMKVWDVNRARAAESATAPASETGRRFTASSRKIVALGSSTGGTEALRLLVGGLPSTAPAILVVQHLPVAFSASFAKHVNDATEMRAGLASDGEPVMAGHIYIAPGDRHLALALERQGWVCRLLDGPPVNRHKPSVEVLFRSVAEQAGSAAIGVMLTGMGADGAKAMLEMRDAGAVNIVQDEATSVVWGMPGEAYRLGAAHHVVPLERIAAQILALTR